MVAKIICPETIHTITAGVPSWILSTGAWEAITTILSGVYLPPFNDQFGKGGFSLMGVAEAVIPNARTVTFRPNIYIGSGGSKVAVNTGAGYAVTNSTGVQKRYWAAFTWDVYAFDPTLFDEPFWECYIDAKMDAGANITTHAYMVAAVSKNYIYADYNYTT